MRALSMVHQADAGPGVFAERMVADGVELEVWNLGDEPDPPGDPSAYDAVMTFGGAMHVDQGDRHAWISREQEILRELIDGGTPLLGACLGAQLLCVAGGGSVTRMPEPEIGWFDVEVTDPADPVVGPLAPSFNAFEWHSYRCEPPPGAAILASSDACVQAFRIGERAWGIQFHAEVNATDAGKWIEEWDTDPDAVRIGLDHEALRRETQVELPAWNEIGREMAGSFCRAVATHA